MKKSFSISSFMKPLLYYADAVPLKRPGEQRRADVTLRPRPVLGAHTSVTPGPASDWSLARILASHWLLTLS